jgi:hypothetical protein
MQNPSILAIQRDSKNDSIFGARREMQAPHDAMHRASMGAPELQSNWPEMRKTLGKVFLIILHSQFSILNS